MLTTHKMCIVIIVPAWHCIYDLISFITDSTECRIDQWTATRCYQYFIDSIIQSFHLLGKGNDSFTEIEVTFCSRIIGKMFTVSFYNTIFEFFWNRKNRRVKIADSKIINTLPLTDLLPYFTTEFYNFRTN